LSIAIDEAWEYLNRQDDASASHEVGHHRHEDGATPLFALPNLRVLDLRHNQLTHTREPLHWQWLYYSGQSEGKIENTSALPLTSLYLEHNRFHGPLDAEAFWKHVPSTTASDPNGGLKYLYLEHNHFTGNLFSLADLTSRVTGNGSMGERDHRPSGRGAVPEEESAVIPFPSSLQSLFLFHNPNLYGEASIKDIKAKCPRLTNIKIVEGTKIKLS
jgi:hypothetical protein